MKFSKALATLSIALPSISFAQEEIPPQRMVELLRVNPILCGVPLSGSQQCTDVEEYSFITDTRGFLVSTLIFEVNESEYLRITSTDTVTVTDEGICSTGSEVLENAHLEIVRDQRLEGDFRRYELRPDFREQVEDLFLRPVIEMFADSTFCARYFLPEDQTQPNEISYVAYLDGEVFEEGRDRFLGISDTSRIVLSIEE